MKQDNYNEHHMWALTMKFAENLKHNKINL